VDRHIAEVRPVEKRGLRIGEKRVKSGMDASREALEWSGIPAEGDILLTRLPGIPPSGFSALRRTGFRSHHGCAAAGVFHPSSSRPSVELLVATSSTNAHGVSMK
jgi:hypothetical protein